MILFSIGSDRNIAHKESNVYKRIESYATFCEHIYMYVFSLKRHGIEGDMHAPKIDIRFTQSRSKVQCLWDAYTQASREMSKVHGDIVVSVQDPFETGLVGLLLSRKFNAPLYVQIHADMYSSFFKRQSLLNRMRLFIGKFVLKRAAVVRVVSEKIKHDVVERLPIKEDRIVVLPIYNQYVPVKRTKPPHPYLLVVSRLESEKNIDAGLRICSQAIKQMPEISLKIAGTGRNMDALKRLCHTLQIADKVDFLGEVSIEKLAGLYGGASCLVHFSSYEGFGLVLYEAMKSDCPIVTTQVGIAPDIYNLGYPISMCALTNMDCFVASIDNFVRDFSTKRYDCDLSHMSRDKEEYIKKYEQSLRMALRQ